MPLRPDNAIAGVPLKPWGLTGRDVISAVVDAVDVARLFFEDGVQSGESARRMLLAFDAIQGRDLETLHPKLYGGALDERELQKAKVLHGAAR